jgi:hypothetical protein
MDPSHFANEKRAIFKKRYFADPAGHREAERHLSSLEAGSMIRRKAGFWRERHLLTAAANGKGWLPRCFQAPRRKEAEQVRLNHLKLR